MSILSVFILLSSFAVLNVATQLEPDSPKERVRRFSAKDALTETKFWLYTRKNRDEAQSLRDGDINSVRDSNFNPSLPTRILIHGFASKQNSTFNRAIKNAYLDKGEFNVIVIDWASLGGSKKFFFLYPIIANSVHHIGKLVASFTQFLHGAFGVSFKNIYLIGHSLGAHVAGYAANEIRPEKFHTIYALDPAGPTFDPTDKEHCIDADDADYVESIQTNLGIRASFNLGQSQNIGKAAFYPNFGDNQPGCSTTPMCSHSRAYKIFAESINNDIIAKKCSDVNEIFDRDCTSGEPTVFVGGEPSRSDRSGVFYLKTGATEPLAQNNYAKASEFVTIWLFTRDVQKEFYLKDTVKALTDAQFNSERPTRFVICDFNSKSSSAITSCVNIKEAYTSRGDYNLFYVHWENAVISKLYKKEIFADDIGRLAAEFSKVLRDNFNVPLDSIYIVGAGTGAQIAHYAAKNIHPEKYDTIFVLDHHKPLPSVGTKYLEAIQTSTLTRHEGATFFPNYNAKKTSCAKLDFDCTHELAYQYFKDSLSMPLFSGIECAGIRGTEQNNCVRLLSNAPVKMGGDPSTHKEPGSYYRATKLD